MNDIVTSKPPDPNALADDISFGLEQTALCLSTDLITDPHIAQNLQKRLQPQHISSLSDNMVAEGIGDFIGLGAFVVLRQAFRPAFTQVHNGVRWALDPIYDPMMRSRLNLTGKKELTQQEAHHLAELKNFEADTFEKSNELSVLSTVANAAVMKTRGSPYNWPVLLVSKFAATTITTLGMIGLRWAFPQPMRKFDRKLNQYAVEPALNFVGVKSAHIAHALQESPIQELREHGLWQDRVQQPQLDHEHEQGRAN